MTFIPVALQLQNAVKTSDFIKVEELILTSDSKKDLIKELVLENGKDSLLNLLPKFRSKGLVLTIQNLLDL